MACPFCGSENIREIIYGEIGFRDEKDELEFNKKYFEGGDEVKDLSVQAGEKFHCDGCGKNFGGRTREDVKPGMRVAIV